MMDKKPTQTELAFHVGISQGAFSNILNLKRRPSWRLSKQLAKAFGTNPELWLEGTTDEMKSAIENFYLCQDDGKCAA